MRYIVVRLLPPNLQIVFFSATWDDTVVCFAQQFIGGPANQIRLQAYELTLDYVKQFFIDCDNEEDRFDVLVGLYSIMTISQSIIFVHVSPYAWPHAFALSVAMLGAYVTRYCAFG